MTESGSRPARLAAAALAVTALVLVAAAVLIWGAGGFRELPTSFARGVPVVVAGMFAALCYVGAGWLIASRMPRHPIGWLLLTMGLVFATMTPTSLMVDAALRAFRPAPPATLAAAWLLSSFSAPFLVGGLITTGLLFPDGRVVGPRWRWGLVLTIAGAIVLALATAVRPAGLIWYPTLPNPFAAPAALRPIIPVATGAATLLLVAGAGIMVPSLVVRYRRGDATVRAQLRWTLYAGAALVVVIVPFMIVRFVVPAGPAIGELTVALADATLALLPIAMAVAITRYRLFGIDFIVSRALVYVPMMAILGGLYTAAIAIFQRVFVAVTGETSDAPLVIAIFVVAAAFTPVRKSLEGVVDRWTRAARAPNGPASGALTDDTDASVGEVAARVIALRHLEARMASGMSTPGPRSTSHRLAIDADGRVACPVGGDPPFVACLSCQYLTALLTDPPTVVCRRPAPPTAGAVANES